MRYLKLVGHDLIGMFAMRFAQMLVQKDTVTNGKHGIHTIDGEERYK